MSSSGVPAIGSIIVISGTANYDGAYAVLTATASTFTIEAPFVGDEASGTWRSAGGGLVPGCSTAGATGAIALSYVPSRVNGIAPLAVFFDATATSASATSRPFHDLEYQWDFGDPGSGDFGDRTTGSEGTGFNKSRNRATGPVAAHIYETPGTYTVTLTVFDGVNTVSNACLQIVVLDPDAFYAGPRTTCVSASGNFSGCPAGANRVTTSSFTPRTIFASGARRLLLRAGETFSASLPDNEVSVPGPWTIAAFGGSAKAVVQPAANTSGIRLFSTRDGRIVDVEVNGSGDRTRTGIAGFAGVDHITMLRVHVHDTGAGLIFPQTIALFDHIAVQDSTIERISGGGQNGAFIASSRMMILGNLIDDTTGPGAEHGFRTQFANRAVISNNVFSRANAGRTVLTIRGPDFDTGQPGVYPPGLFTEKVVISDNKFVPSALQLGTVGNGPQNDTSDERIRDVIWERNWWVAPPAPHTLSVHFDFTVSDITIRNNIFELSRPTSGGIRAMQVRMTNTSPGYPAPDRVKIFHNTIFSSDDISSAFGLMVINIHDSVLGIEIRNNLGYAPSSGSPGMIVNLGTPFLVESNNTTNAQLNGTSPNFAAMPPAAPPDYRPTGSSYAINGGTAVPVWSDFFRSPRPQGAGFDIGAIEQ